MNPYNADEWHYIERCERETFLHIMQDPDSIILYTSDWRTANRAIKKGLEPTKVYRMKSDHCISGVEFEVCSEDRTAIRTITSMYVLSPRAATTAAENGDEPIQTANYTTTT